MVHRITLSWLLALLTSCAAGGGDGDVDCVFSSDCSDGYRCRMGACILDGEGTCPPGEIRTPDGCETESRCRDNDDCPEGRCVNGQCFVNICDDGDERPCGTPECQRVQRCQDGVWRPCSVGRNTDGGRCDPETSTDGSMDAVMASDGGMPSDALVEGDGPDLRDAAPPEDVGSVEDASPIADARPNQDAAIVRPANDRCVGAGRLASNGVRRVRGDTRDATQDRGNGPDVWYRITLDQATNIEATLVGLGNWDTYLYLYRGDCDDLTLVASNDDDPGIGRSRIEAEALVPGTYHILVSGFGADDAGVFDLTLTFREFVVANDLCDDSIQIQAVGEQRRAGDTTGAGREYGPIGRGGDVWYRFSLDVPTNLRVQVTGEENWDTYLYLLRGRCGDAERVAFNDDFEGVGQSLIEESGLAAGEYFLVVSGFNNESFGPFELAANFLEARPYNEAVFMATHNSYSGGDRGSIIEQLNLGVRVLELDIHDDDYGDLSDFQIGHDGPGDEVALGAGNPNADRLGLWLSLIATWSDMNPQHAPITIVLDIKDDLVDNRSVDDGNLAALNGHLLSAFGNRLFWSTEMGDRGEGWPYIHALRGQILVVLSGREQDRRAYRADEGHHPAVALNSNRQVVEVHDDGRDDLWYWNGELDVNTGAIDWTGHARYDSGQFPAVALNDAGVVVEVHRSEDALTLWYRVGLLRPDGTGIDFGESHRFDSGVLPSIRFTGPNTVREIHQSQNNNQRWQNVGVVNVAARTINWADNERTNDPFYSRDRASVSIAGVQRFVAVSAADETHHLSYQTNGVNSAPIRYQAVAFVEAQAGEDDFIDERTHFLATEASNGDAARFLAQWTNRDAVVRLWAYSERQAGLRPHLPATDEPFSDWYLQLMTLFAAYEVDN